MIGILFAAIMAIIVAFGGMAVYYKHEAAQVAPLRTALDKSLVAIEQQGKAIEAQDKLLALTDQLHAQQLADQADAVRVITVYREKQREQAANDAALAVWGTTRLPDAVVNRLREHDARYRDQAQAGGAPRVDDRANPRAAAASERGQQ